MERRTVMDTAVKQDYMDMLGAQQKEVRQLVLDGLKQVSEGKTKDFNSVCDRLEKKYIDAT